MNWTSEIPFVQNRKFAFILISANEILTEMIFTIEIKYEILQRFFDTMLSFHSILIHRSLVTSTTLKNFNNERNYN